MKIICTVINDLTFDRRMHRICTSLQENGHEVILIGRKLKKSQPLQSHIFKQRRVRCFFNKGKFFYLEYNFRLWWILLFSSFDVICSIDLDTILPGFYISKIKGKTCVYDAHEYFSEVPEVVNRRLTKAIWERVASLVIPKIKYAYTVSQSLAEELTTRYKTDFKLVRNITTTYQTITDFDKAQVIKKFKLDTSSDKTILLYQGALNEGRGIEAIFKAIQQMDHVILWLAGEGDLSQFLRKEAQALAIKDRVQFLGFVQPKDLKIITRLADIGLNLLENKGKSYYFSLANKTFDYIQAEKPALHPAFPEYKYLNDMHEIGVLVPDLSTESIVLALQKLINEPVFYQKIVLNCRKAKQEFTWENEEKALLDIYKNMRIKS